MRQARERFSRLSADLSRDEVCARLLSAYGDAIEATGLSMRQTGMVDTCSVCAGGASGSCCFQGVEGWYDETLLLINLLLGAGLPDRRRIPGHCFFLGNRGCTLPARHSFCINYLCPALTRSMTAESQRRFLSTAGVEILAGWELERYLRARLVPPREVMVDR